MQRILSLALVVLGMTTTLPAQKVDNSLGTWKANIAASKYTPAPWPVKSLTVVREAAPGGVKVTTSGERIDGTVVDASYTANYDGQSKITGWALTCSGYQVKPLVSLSRVKAIRKAQVVFLRPTTANSLFQKTGLCSTTPTGPPFV